MPTTKRKSAKKSKKPEAKLINLKVSVVQEKILLAKAKKFANGNLSSWLRYAALNYNPARLTPVPPTRPASYVA